MRTLLLLGAVLGASACGKSMTDYVDELDKLTARMCECKDLKCAQAVVNDMHAFSERLPKQDPHMSKAEEEQVDKRLDALGDKFDGCVKPWQDKGLEMNFEH